MQNFRVLQLLSAAEQRLEANEVGPRVAPILQHLIPELRSLRPVELAALCKGLSAIGWQDSLVDLVLGVVCTPSSCCLPLSHETLWHSRGRFTPPMKHRCDLAQLPALILHSKIYC